MMTIGSTKADMKKYLFTILVMIIIFTFLYHATPLFDSIKSDSESSIESETGDENKTTDEDKTTDNSVDLPTPEI